MRPKAVLVVEDHALIREGIKRALPAAEFSVKAEAATLGEARLLFVSGLKVDAAIVDYGLPDSYGPEAARTLIALRPGLQVLILSAYDEPNIVIAAIRSGASAVVKKTESVAVVVEALRCITSGRSYLSRAASDLIIDRIREIGFKSGEPKLTARQLDVLRLIAEGRQTKEIASRLMISENTVKTHRREMMRTFGVTNVVQLLAIAQEHRLAFVGRSAPE